MSKPDQGSQQGAAAKSAMPDQGGKKEAAAKPVKPAKSKPWGFLKSLTGGRKKNKDPVEGEGVKVAVREEELQKDGKGDEGQQLAGPSAGPSAAGPVPSRDQVKHRIR